MQSELIRTVRDFMYLFVVDNGGDNGISLEGIDPVEFTDRFAALEAALSAAEPVAAMTTDYLGCEYVSMDVAGIEKIAAAHSKGPTEVVYLYAAPPVPSAAVKALEWIVQHPEESNASVWDVAKNALSAQVQDVTSWRPIETAPKDGTPILGGHSEAVLTVWWEADGSQNNSGEPGWIDGSFNSVEENYTYPVTHWMPLPAAPAKQEG